LNSGISWLRRAKADSVSAMIVRSVLILCLTGGFASAEEKKSDTEKKPEPPRVTLVSPLGVAAGSTNTIKIRGANLTNSPTLLFPSLQPPPESNQIRRQS